MFDRIPIFFFLIFALLIGSSLRGQHLHLSYYSQSNGLPSNMVRDVIQDEYGFFWIATDSGLLRFNGTKFSLFSQHIPSHYGRSFCKVPEGLLLSHDAGISLIQPGLDDSEVSIYLPASIYPDDEGLYYPDRLFLRKNGELWISQPGGRVNRSIDQQLEDITTFPELTKDPKATAFFAEPQSGPLWIAFSDGRLCTFDDQTQRLTLVLELPQINDLKVWGRELWLAGANITRLTLSEDGQEIQHKKDFYSNIGEAQTLSFDSQGNVYLGIKNKGLHLLDQRSGQHGRLVKIYSNNNPHNLSTLPFRQIHKIMVDADDRLWVCAAEGLGILQRRFLESLSAIPNAYTSSICIADNGKIFASFGDIYSIASTDQGYEGALLQAFSGGNVTALTAAKDWLWAGSSTGQLFRLSQQGAELGTIDLRQRGEGIFHMRYDSRGRLWVCQAPEERPLTGILCILPDGNQEEYGTEKGLLSQVRCLLETERGNIYCSGEGKETYLYRYLPEEDAFINLSLQLDFDPGVEFAVHDLAMDKKGVIWLASTHGLLRYDMERTDRIDLGIINSDTEMRAVSALDDGSVWASTETQGILRYADSTAVMLGEESGLPSEVMTYRCLVNESEGRIWAGSSEGLVYSFDEHPAPRSSHTPMLVAAHRDGYPSSTQEITMYHDQQLRLDVIAPSYHGSKSFFQYRLNQGAWHDLGTKRYAELTDLDPGMYDLAFRSRKEGGYLWSDALELKLKVKKYGYENPVAASIFIAFLLICLVVFLLKRKRGYMQKISELKQVLRQDKTEIERTAADLKQAEENIVFEQNRSRAQLFGMEIVRRLISKISPGMKWDMVLEIISDDLLKFPGIVAFEIASRKGKNIELEGYAEHKKGFTSASLPYQPEADFACHALDIGRPMLFNQLKMEMESLSLDKAERLAPYESALSVPFFLKNQSAVIIIYSNNPDYFTKYGIKAIEVFAAYLDQII